MGRKKKKKKGPGGAASRLVVTFDEEKRREYLTGFHKRKVERRKVALEEIKRKLKEEQRKMKEERHKEYLKMLSEREEALEEYDELEHLVTSQTESVNIDHPNHIVTVTTISDLDLSGARQLGLTTPEVQPLATSVPKYFSFLALPRISALTATLHMRSQKKSKGKRPQRGQGPHQKIQKPAMRRTTKTQRRRLTGKMGRDQD
uniref:Nucleolar protein 12 n=1 Tax=Cairina moschata TaxID=8855 RepID=A0A8C3BIJ0_CAIMO